MLRFLSILYILIRLLLRAAFGLGTIAYAVLTWRDRHSVDALGTARFATWWEMLLAGVRRGNGPIVGRIGRSFLRFNKDGMVTVRLRADGGRQRRRHRHS